MANDSISWISRHTRNSHLHLVTLACQRNIPDYLPEADRAGLGGGNQDR